MSGDTVEEKEVCKASGIHECGHFDYVNPNSRKTDSSDYTYVGAQLLPQRVFHLQKIADEEFPAGCSDKVHPGNRSRVIEELLQYGIDRYNQVEGRGTLGEKLRQGEQEESNEEDVQALKERLEKLEEKNKTLNRQIEEKEDDLRELKKENNLVSQNSDIMIHIVDVLSDGPYTIQVLVEKLKKEKDLGFREYQHPLDPQQSIGLRNLTDFFLKRLVDGNAVEVTRKNGRTVYEAK